MSFLRASTSIAGLASSSSSARCWTTFRSAAALHTSAVRSAESHKQRTARIVRKTNVERKAERDQLYEANKPHVVLGTRPGDDAKWLNCDLAKTLVSEDELAGLPAPRPEGEVQAPEHLSYGLDGLDGAETKDEQLRFFFEQLPDASALAEVDVNLMDKLGLVRGQDAALNPEDKRALVMLQVREQEKAKQLARVVDLRNANARGISFENRRRIIAAFSPTKEVTDSGYPEVQVALLTMKIRNIWSHLMQRKKDIHGRRALRMVVHQRAKMLKYIKRVDRHRYDRILARVGVEPESVEGELVV
ncbi:hypothetical protein DFH11DRAFT_1873111 [Phellopilus nigrolimitatus]|nr:hypothetical protein DFH11DRAFT_1873111 [Phellopilus nigrolimitatus]